MCMEGKLYNELNYFNANSNSREVDSNTEIRKYWNYCIRYNEIVNTGLVRRGGMTWHRTVINLFSFNASVGTEGSNNKTFIPNPISVSKKVFQFPVLQQKYFFPFNQNWLKKLQEAKDAQWCSAKYSFPSFLISRAVKLRLWVIKHHPHLQNLVYIRKKGDYVTNENIHFLFASSSSVFSFLKSWVLHHRNSYVS